MMPSSLVLLHPKTERESQAAVVVGVDEEVVACRQSSAAVQQQVRGSYRSSHGSCCGDIRGSNHHEGGRR